MIEYIAKSRIVEYEPKTKLMEYNTRERTVEMMLYEEFYNYGYEEGDYGYDIYNPYTFDQIESRGIK